MPPQVNPTVSGVLFESDTQTADLGLDKDVSVLKNATPRKHQLVWFNIIWFLYLHIASLYGLWLVFTSAKWQTNVFGKKYIFIRIKLPYVVSVQYVFVSINSSFFRRLTVFLILSKFISALILYAFESYIILFASLFCFSVRCTLNVRHWHRCGISSTLDS